MANSPSSFEQRKPALCKQLKQLIDKDLSDLDQLHTTLLNEAQALKDRNSTEIEVIAKTKGTLVKNIEDRARAKVKLITASGAPIEAGKVKMVIDARGDAELSTLWSQSLNQLEQCKELNQVNGLVIERSRSRNQKIMDMVRGKHQKPKLYGEKGGESTYSGTNRIAKA